LSFVKNVTAVFGVRLIGIFLGIICSIIVTRILGPTNRGSLEILITVPYLLVTFGSLGIGNANLYYAAKGKYPIEKIVGNSMSLVFILGILLLLIGFGLFWGFSDSLFADIPLQFISLSLFLIPILLFLKYTDYIFLGKELISIHNQINLFQSIGYFILVIIFVILFKLMVLGVLIAKLFAAFLAFLFALNFLKKICKIGTTLDLDLLCKSIKYGFIAFLALVVLNLNYKLDIFLTKYFLDNTAVGFYSLGVSLAEKIWLIPEAAALVLYSKISNLEKEEADTLTPKVCRFTLFLSTLIACGMFATGNVLIPLVYGKAFKPAVLPFFILLPGIIFMSLLLCLHSDLTGRGKPIITLKIFTVSLLINCILNICWIPSWGIYGTALSSTISYTFGALWLSIAFSKLTGVKMKSLLFINRGDYIYYIKPAINAFLKKSTK